MRQNQPILQLWAPGRTHGRPGGHIFEKTIFENPLQRMQSIKKGGGKNTRAFCLLHTASIPVVLRSCVIDTADHTLWRPEWSSGMYVDQPLLLKLYLATSRAASPSKHARGRKNPYWRRAPCGHPIDPIPLLRQPALQGSVWNPE